MAAAQVQVQHSIGTEQELKSRLATKGLKGAPSARSCAASQLQYA